MLERAVFRCIETGWNGQFLGKLKPVGMGSF